MKVGAMEATRPAQDRPAPLQVIPGGVPREEPREETNSAGRNDLAAAVDILNQAVERVDKGLRFRLHEETRRLQVEVVNRPTNEVIKVIPPDEILDLVARIHAMVGLFLDQRI